MKYIPQTLINIILSLLSHISQCFFARLGFVQPPSCLKCAYQSSGCGKNNNNNNNNSSCRELVPWRRDANVPLHPDKLEGNVVFVTCDTAKSLVNGDAYPSIRWDTRNKRLLHEIWCICMYDWQRRCYVWCPRRLDNCVKIGVGGVQNSWSLFLDVNGKKSYQLESNTYINDIIIRSYDEWNKRKSTKSSASLPPLSCQQVHLSFQTKHR